MMETSENRHSDPDKVSQIEKCTAYKEFKRRRVDAGAVMVGSRRGTRVLRDEDSTSVVVRSRKRLNTLAHYQLTDGASLALQTRQLYASSVKNGTVKQHNGMCNVLVSLLVDALALYLVPPAHRPAACLHCRQSIATSLTSSHVMLTVAKSLWNISRHACS